VGATSLLIIAISACGTANSTSDAQQAADALNAGLRAQAAGKTSEAINDYNTVLQHDPKNKYAFYNLGLIDQQAGRADSAQTYYRKALTIDPEFAPALFNLAILRTVPSPNEAADLYRHVLSIQPNNADAHLNLGFVLRTLGRNDESAAEFAKAVALNPASASRLPPGALPSPSASPKPSASASPKPTHHP
jgi:tetratricopeptide (TPR) repeat protein